MPEFPEHLPCAGHCETKACAFLSLLHLSSGLSPDPTQGLTSLARMTFPVWGLACQLALYSEARGAFPDHTSGICLPAWTFRACGSDRAPACLIPCPSCSHHTLHTEQILSSPNPSLPPGNRQASGLPHLSACSPMSAFSSQGAAQMPP